MASRDLVIGVIFLTQTVFGILGNFSLLYYYIFLSFTGCRLRPTDLIVKHLVAANSLSLLCKGVPQMMAAFGWNNFPGDFGCKLLFYLHRIGRGVSIGSTCLLSAFQAITISPQNARGTKLKRKALKYIDFSIFLCWTVYMLVNIICPIYVTGKRNNVSISMRRDLQYCWGTTNNKITRLLHAVLLSFPDVLCLGIMVWANGQMVFILHRHRQRVQHIHSTNVSPRSSPESRAAQSILVLVSTFVSPSSTFSCHLALSENPSWWELNPCALITPCFVLFCFFLTVSPFVLWSPDLIVSRIVSARCRMNTQQEYTTV
uniref:Vomeronasal type-1 receptor n=1 Tax=Felis catus TaxID=9685 RepID=A0ABI8A301_FELCA